MITVWLCTFPAMFAGMYAIGHNANEALAALGLAAADGWRGAVIGTFAGFDPASAWDCLVLGRPTSCPPTRSPSLWGSGR